MNFGGRDAIVNAVYVCMSDASDDEVRKAAFDCVIRMAELYYANLGAYMDKLAGITSQAALGAADGDDSIAVAAVEFWSAIADEEKQLALDHPQNKRFILTYIGGLVKMLTTLMTRVSADDGEDEYTTAQAAGVCLQNCAAAAEDAALAPVMEFVSTGFAHAKWEVRDAASLAFGCILEGPSDAALKPLINQALGTLIARLSGPARDASAIVRETTAWVLHRAISLHFDAIDASTHFQPLLAATFAALDDEPRVAAQATTIVSCLATPCGPRAVAEDAPGAAGTPLSPFFEPLVTKLLALTDVPAWREWKLRVCAFEAINELIAEGASEREGAFLMQLLHEVGRRLAAAADAAPASAEDRGNVESQLVQLTGLAQMLIMELDDQVAPLAPQLVALLLRVGDARHAVTAENAMRAIGAVADSVGAAFAPLLPAVLPRIHACIVNVGEPAVCAAGVWACGEVVRNSGEAVNAHVEAIVITLLDILKKAETSQDAKAAALAVFGDIASSLGPNVARYLQGMMVLLDKAARTAPVVRCWRALPARARRARRGRAAFFFSTPIILPAALLPGRRRRRRSFLHRQPAQVGGRGLAGHCAGLFAHARRAGRRAPRHGRAGRGARL